MTLLFKGKSKEFKVKSWLMPFFFYDTKVQRLQLARKDFCIFDLN